VTSVSGTSERDTEICTSILRGLETTATQCEELAADYSAGNDTDSAIDMHHAALRYRQLAARAMGNWADADALAALTANAAADPETDACDTRELPRVR